MRFIWCMLELVTIGVCFGEFYYCKIARRSCSAQWQSNVTGAGWGTCPIFCDFEFWTMVGSGEILEDIGILLIISLQSHCTFAHPLTRYSNYQSSLWYSTPHDPVPMSIIHHISGQDRGRTQGALGHAFLKNFILEFWHLQNVMLVKKMTLVSWFGHFGAPSVPQRSPIQVSQCRILY